MTECRRRAMCPVYFTFDNPGILQPGVYAEVYLITCSRDSVLSVPRSALTEQEGNYAVFVKVHDDAYEKRAGIAWRYRWQQSRDKVGRQCRRHGRYPGGHAGQAGGIVRKSPRRTFP